MNAATKVSQAVPGRGPREEEKQLSGNLIHYLFGADGGSGFRRWVCQSLHGIILLPPSRLCVPARIFPLMHIVGKGCNSPV